MDSATSLDESAPLHLARVTLLRRECRVLLDGRPVEVGPRSFDLLMALAIRPGRLVTKDELLERVWPGQHVEEGNIAVQVFALRRVLGNDIIATVPGRGYRLTLPIDASAVSKGDVSAHSRDRRAANEPAISDGLLTGLPYGLPPLLGRADDSEKLAALVERHRLVSVIGPGGVGKTLLVQHLLDTQRHTYRHGVCWVELATLVDAEAISDTIVAALGVQARGSSPAQRLASAMAPLQILVALDNVEHLLQPVAELARLLLGAAPDVRLVLTSQAPLHATGEQCYRLGALDVPTRPVGAREALRFGAVALFDERARAADSRFVLTEANVPAVVEVCRRLDGLPLAIELAAARAPVLGVHRLAASMDDRLTLLASGRNASAPERLRTLRAALDWSHSLLADVEQAVFRRMAVVAGSASLEFIQELAADPPGGEIDDAAVLNALCVLVDRSLVAVIDVPGSDLPRYGLLESPKAYALDQLKKSGELDRIRRQHVRACVHMVERLRTAMDEGKIGRDERARQMAPDLANARDAMAEAKRVRDNDNAATIGFAILRALPMSMFTDLTVIADSVSELLASGVSAPVRLRGWLELGKVWDNTSRRTQAQAMWRQALDAARRLDSTPENRVLLYAALGGSVYSVATTGDVAGAAALLDELRVVEDPTWPPARLLIGVQAARGLAIAKGDASERLQLARKEHAMRLATGEDDDPAGLVNLINAQIFARQFFPAIEAASRLVAALETGRDEFVLCFARRGLVEALLAIGNVARARDIAPLGWSAAPRLDLVTLWIDLLAKLCRMENRPRSAALLLGFSQAQAELESVPRDPEEAAEFEEISQLVRQAIGDREFAALQRQGADLCVDDVAGFAFGRGDPPSSKGDEPSGPISDSYPSAPTDPIPPKWS